MVYIDKHRMNTYKADLLNIVKKLEDLTIVSMEEFLKDEKAILSMRYLIIKAVEAMTDIGKHLLAKISLKPVEEYGECFRELGKANLITEELATNLIGIAGLRNLLIHRYWNVDDKRVFQECKNGLKDFYEFIRQVDILLEKYPNKSK